MNAVAQDVAKRHPKVHYVDTYKLFSDTDGKFAYDLPDENGNVTTMRAGDGVHFTIDGADYLARQVYKLVDAQCGVTAQKVDGATKQTIETEGSTQVAPGATSNSGNSSGSNSSGLGRHSAAAPSRPRRRRPRRPTTSPPVDTTPVDRTPATDARRRPSTDRHRRTTATP